MKKAAVIILCIVILMTLPVSCGEKDKMSDYPFSLGGVKFTEKPKKVVSLSSSFLEIIYYMQLNGTIAGRAEDCLVEEAENRPTFGTQSEPDVDKLISEKIDVVLCDTDLPEEASASLLKAGVKVLKLNPATSRASLKQLYANLGAVMAGAQTGKTRGENAADTLMIAMDDIQRTYGGDENPVTVCMVYDTGLIKVATGDTMMNFVIESAGGINIALDAEGYQFDTSLLKIANPQFVLCPEGIGYDLRRNTEYQDLQAFRNRRVYELDKKLLTYQGDSLLELTQKVADLIHPNFFANQEGGNTESGSRQKE